MVKEYCIHGIGGSHEHLKRRFEIYADRCLVSPNPKYNDKMETVVELKDSRVSPTPSTEPTHEGLAQAALLEGPDIMRHRSCMGILLDMGVGRSDIQHAVRRLSPGMKSPTRLDWEGVTKVVIYLRLTRDYKNTLPSQGQTGMLEAFPDASFADDRRRSTLRASSCPVARCCTPIRGPRQWCLRPAPKRNSTRRRARPRRPFFCMWS